MSEPHSRVWCCNHWCPLIRTSWFSQITLQFKALNQLVSKKHNIVPLKVLEQGKGAGLHTHVLVTCVHEQHTWLETSSSRAS